MRKFDTKVQHLKFKVLAAVAKAAFDGNLEATLPFIPEMIIPGKEPTMRCCVYKERAIVNERVKLAMGGDKHNPNVIEVIGIACDECPMGGYEVTGACRGCLAHRCEDVCARHAITFDAEHAAHIDKSKCVQCGRCAKVCPYSAIMNFTRPCERACKVDAITMDSDQIAVINKDKCIACGACVYQCPWGAIMDKSYILDAIRILRNSETDGSKVYAVVAPSISSQFIYTKLEQVIGGIKALGFHSVVEAALGADMVALEESKELAEKGMLLSSCCPSFVMYVKQRFPKLAEHISHNLSPAATIAKYIKTHDATAKVVFIGPCTSKKMEFSRCGGNNDSVENSAVSNPASEWVDCALTFEELEALFAGKQLDITTLEGVALDNASYFGRIFARSGGLSDAVAEGLKENGITDFTLNALPCDGIEACKAALMKLSANVLNANFVEGMACIGGCIGGAGCLTHGEKNKREVDKYGEEALEKTIRDAVSQLGIGGR